MTISRRDLFRHALAAGAVFSLPSHLWGCRTGPGAEAPGAGPDPESAARLARWVRTLRAEGLAAPGVALGRGAARAGELAVGTPYVAYTLEEYLKAGGSPMRAEPLTLDLTRFDCVSLVESCLAVARVARQEGEPGWERFAREMERMRYRGGKREGYASRLHYFSEWLSDSERRGLVRQLGRELGGEADTRSLRFMTEHASSYPALRHPEVREQIAAMERSLDGHPRYFVPTARIPEAAERIRTGDVLGFATGIEGLDVTHSAFAYRDAQGVLRVLHAPLSGGAVEVSRSTLPQYVANIKRSTGILVARPLPG